MTACLNSSSSYKSLAWIVSNKSFMTTLTLLVASLDIAPVSTISFYTYSNSNRAFSSTRSMISCTYMSYNLGILPSFCTVKLVKNSASGTESAASTSSELLVTPPLLVDASLNIIMPICCSLGRTASVQNRLAPSTSYLNRGLPFLNSLV